MTPTQMRLAAERKARLERMQQASLQHFDRCYDEAQVLLPKLAPLPPPPAPTPAPQPAPLVSLPDDSPQRMPGNIVTIQRVVSEYFGINRATLLSKSQRRIISRPRQVAMFLVREFCPHMSYPAIGKHFGGRDHTTTLHGIRTIKERLRTDPAVANAIKTVRGQLSHLRGWA